ncbi:MAG TPA: nucleoside deaminase [Candidatus Saccharimonadales bacterium]|jgi:guanine deaminase|nr:nucleoside deaminase [Candidatus Saccharimonadales bacterium]
MSDKIELIRKTIDLAVENVKAGGGPFAAMVVKEGKTIAIGTNQVTPSLDPTAHAEVVAIRRACQALGSFELTGCEIYSSCEPCPMCLGAIYWARPARVYFAATGPDAAQAGFDDTFIKEQFALPYQKQKIPVEHLAHENALAPFSAWKAKADKVEY